MGHWAVYGLGVLGCGWPYGSKLESVWLRAKSYSATVMFRLFASAAAFWLFVASQFLAPGTCYYDRR